jgi:hypothetical protein
MLYELDKYSIWTGVSIDESERDDSKRYTDIPPPSEIPSGNLVQLRYKNWVLVDGIPESDLARERSFIKKNVDDQIEKLIEQVRPRITKHHEEITLGLTPTEDITSVLLYIKALRDIPNQDGYPEVVNWPVEEDFISSTYSFNKVQSLLSASFTSTDLSRNRWLNNKDKPSNTCPFLLPINCNLKSFSFNNDSANTSATIQIWKFVNGERTIIFEFEATGHSTNLVEFETKIELMAGDALAVFVSATNLEVAPANPVLDIYFEARELNNQG